MLRRVSSKKDRSSSLSAKASSPIEKKNNGFSKDKEVANTGSQHYSVQTFTFLELLTATNNFRADCFLGEGEFGKVYKGWLKASNQVVAIKQFDLDGLQGNLEFLIKALKLSFHHHPFLVNFIGLCADGEQRLLVCEYMPLGSLDDQLFGKGWLDWDTRIKIAGGAAKGLEFLHNKVTSPVIYGDLKCSSILLGDGHHPKLSSFGLAKLVLFGDNSNVPTRATGTHGYHAPEYAMTGQLTLKTDIYSLGVVILEMITGMRAIDKSRKAGEQSLVAWAHSMSKTRRKIFKMVDPRLHGQYPKKCYYQVFMLATLCVNKDPTRRPLISDVVTTLSLLSSQAYDTKITSQISTKKMDSHSMKMDSHSCTRGTAYETTTMNTFTKNIPSQTKDVQAIIKERRKLHCEGLSNVSNTVTIVAVLYVTLAFAAIYTIPGGRGTDGVAVTIHTTCFQIFYICNAIALICSFAVLLVQVTLVPVEIKAKRRVVFILNKLVWLATVCTIISFSSSSYILLDNSLRWIAILVTVVGGGLISVLLAALAYKVLKSKKIHKRWKKRKFPRRSAGSNSRRFISSDLELGLIYAV